MQKSHTTKMNRLHHIRTSAWLRRALAAMLSGCVLVCTVGEYLVVNAVQWDMRREVKARIQAGVSAHELAMVKISKNNPPRDFARRNAREIKYQGKMYDIVKQEERSDSIIYYCLFDERETALYANIEQQIRDELAHNPQRQQQEKELLQKIPKFFFLHTNPDSFGFRCYSRKPMSQQFLLSDVFPEILSPPPDILFS